MGQAPAATGSLRAQGHARRLVVGDERRSRDRCGPPRDFRPKPFLGSRQKRVAGGDTSLPPRVMGELKTSGHIASRMNARFGCAQLLIAPGSTSMSAGSRSNATIRGRRPVAIRSGPRGATGHLERNLPSIRRDAGSCSSCQNSLRPSDSSRCCRVAAASGLRVRQHGGPLLDHRHSQVQYGESLSRLHPGSACLDHDKSCGSDSGRRLFRT